MTKITFYRANGETDVIDADDGDSVMFAAVQQGGGEVRAQAADSTVRWVVAPWAKAAPRFRHACWSGCGE